MLKYISSRTWDITRPTHRTQCRLRPPLRPHPRRTGLHPTFPIVRRKDEEKYGEYRTKRMILENYDALEGRFE